MIISLHTHHGVTLPRTIAGIKRVAKSHETDHELCSVDSCEAARDMSAEFTSDEYERERKLQIKALMDELAKQHLDPADYFDDVPAALADIATLDEEPDVIHTLEARVAIKLH